MKPKRPSLVNFNSGEQVERVFWVCDAKTGLKLYRKITTFKKAQKLAEDLQCIGLVVRQDAF